MYISDEHCRQILATIPSRVPAKIKEMALIELDEIVGAYHVLTAHRPQHYPVAAERKRWRRIDDLTEKLAQEMRKLRRETPWSDPDPLMPNRVLAVLWDVHVRVPARLEWLDTFKAFRGTQNPHREFLYSGVLRVWTVRLDGQLKYGRSRKGTPTGPLVRFFLACVEPVLETETPRAGVADIIDRARSKDPV